MRHSQRRFVRRSYATTVAIFLVCALALIHINVAAPGVQIALAEDGQPPCPGGCSSDTIPPPQPTVSSEPIDTVPWYFSLLMLAL
jgi:hypothetical protein